MADALTWLITGANRGIGLGFITVLLARPHTTVIAAVRDVSSPSSVLLQQLPTADGSILIIIPFDNSSPASADTVPGTLQSHNINHIDVVVGNAGISSDPQPPSRTSAEQLQNHFAVNAVGPLLLYQAVKGFLKKSRKGKFVAVSSIVSSIGSMANFQGSGTAYGASKAALNYISSKIHYESKDLIVRVVHPGWAQTDLGNAAAKRVGLEKAPVRVEDSVEKLLEIIDGAEREETITFTSYDGTSIAW